MQRGFEEFYGTIIGAGSFFDPATLCRENQFIAPVNDEKYQPKTYYYTDAISDNADFFAERKITGQTGVSLRVPYHGALADACLPEDIARYKGVYDGGFQKDPRRGLRLRSWG